MKKNNTNNEEIGNPIEDELDAMIKENEEDAKAYVKTALGHPDENEEEAKRKHSVDFVLKRLSKPTLIYKIRRSKNTRAIVEDFIFPVSKLMRCWIRFVPNRKSVAFVKCITFMGDETCTEKEIVLTDTENREMFKLISAIYDNHIKFQLDRYYKDNN